MLVTVTSVSQTHWETVLRS